MTVLKWNVQNRLKRAVVSVGLPIILVGLAQSGYAASLKHTVRPGQTLSGIASHYHVSQTQIINANGLQAVHLQAGQVLNIPDANASIVYRVESGDSLYSVARKYGVDRRELARLNNLEADSQLVIGESLVLPKDANLLAGNTTSNSTSNDSSDYSYTSNGRYCVCKSLSESNPSNNSSTTSTSGSTSTSTSTSIRNVSNLKKHRVTRGETLIQIARDYGVSTSELARVNNISNQSILQIGQVLYIPSSSSGYSPQSNSGSSSNRAGKHTVTSGETLIQVAKDYGVSTSALARANDLSTQSLLQVGQVLTIPSSSNSAQPSSSSSRTRKHTVTSGETLIQVAKDYGVSTSALARANDMSSQALLRVGQVLTIPSSSSGYSPRSNNSTASRVPSTYTVKSGDGLIMLANKFNVRLSELARYNDMGAYDELKIGQTIKIPPNASLD